MTGDPVPWYATLPPGELERRVAALPALLALANAAAAFFGSDQYGDPLPEDEPMIRALNALWDAHPTWREWTS